MGTLRTEVEIDDVTYASDVYISTDSGPGYPGPNAYVEREINVSANGQVLGTIGYAAAPEAVVDALKDEAIRLYKRGPEP